MSTTKGKTWIPVIIKLSHPAGGSKGPHSVLLVLSLESLSWLITFDGSSLAMQRKLQKWSRGQLSLAFSSSCLLIRFILTWENLEGFSHVAPPGGGWVVGTAGPMVVSSAAAPSPFEQKVLTESLFYLEVTGSGEDILTHFFCSAIHLESQNIPRDSSDFLSSPLSVDLDQNFN